MRQCETCEQAMMKYHVLNVMEEIGPENSPTILNMAIAEESVTNISGSISPRADSSPPLSWWIQPRSEGDEKSEMFVLTTLWD